MNTQLCREPLDRPGWCSWWRGPVPPRPRTGTVLAIRQPAPAADAPEAAAFLDSLLVFDGPAATAPSAEDVRRLEEVAAV